jgi:hypothetical protein
MRWHRYRTSRTIKEVPQRGIRTPHRHTLLFLQVKGIDGQVPVGE